MLSQWSVKSSSSMPRRHIYSCIPLGPRNMPDKKYRGAIVYNCLKLNKQHKYDAATKYHVQVDHMTMAEVWTPALTLFIWWVPKVLSNTSSSYGDDLCEDYLKSFHAYLSCGPDNIVKNKT